MKKLILSFVCLMVMGVLSIQAQTAKIILQHGDEATVFAANQLQAAIDAAVDDDVIYLNEGTFEDVNHYSSNAGYYSVSVSKKRLTLIGAGTDKTYVHNFIYLGDSASMTVEEMKLGGIGHVYSGNAEEKITYNVTAQKCIIDKLYSYTQGAGHTFNITIDRCCLSNVLLPFRINSFGIIKNSKIGNLAISNEKGDLLLKNCNITDFNSSDYQVSCENCIFANSNTNDIRILSIVNTLYYFKSAGAFAIDNINNSWKSESALFNSEGECVLSDEDLKSAGYLGTDGTVIGINGGQNPYSLTPTRPRVSDHSIKVDPETKRMTVNLKVTKN